MTYQQCASLPEIYWAEIRRQTQGGYRPQANVDRRVLPRHHEASFGRSCRCHVSDPARISLVGGFLHILPLTFPTKSYTEAPVCQHPRSRRFRWLSSPVSQQCCLPPIRRLLEHQPLALTRRRQMRSLLPLASQVIDCTVSPRSMVFLHTPS